MRHGYFLPRLGAFGDMGMARLACERWASLPTGMLSVERLGHHDGASAFESRDGIVVRVVLCDFASETFRYIVRDT